MNFSIGGGGWGFLGFWIVLGAVGVCVALAVIFFQKGADVVEGERPSETDEQ